MRIIHGRSFSSCGPFEDKVVISEELENPRFDKHDHIPHKCSQQAPLDYLSIPYYKFFFGVILDKVTAMKSGKQDNKSQKIVLERKCIHSS